MEEVKRGVGAEKRWGGAGKFATPWEVNAAQGRKKRLR